MGYLVAVKRSARTVSAGAGRWVQQRGTRREFKSKELARQWARVLSSPEHTCWVQDANPRDASDVDGYLVAARYDDDSGGNAEETPQAPLEDP